MHDYLLFIDTETSGLPKKWNAPYSANNNWPFCLQISWIIYTKEGVEVKLENHYINDPEIKITASAKKIHGISKEFLTTNGEARKDVMQLFADDLIKYNPLVVAHFIELDYKMIGVEFYRSAIENSLKNLPVFCTMLATTNFAINPQFKYLRLGDLYKLLFNQTLQNQHNGMVDARATADCFFELLKRGEITDEKIQSQQNVKMEPDPATENKLTGCTLSLLVIFVFTILIYCML